MTKILNANNFLKAKQILLGVTGGIAAYKSADLVRKLREQGASVRVVMTENAKQFITPLTMQAVSGFPVHEELFDLKAEAAMGHIELARWADVIVIAPATADCMAKLAEGSATDLLTTLCLASKAPLVIAPAMNQAMWKNAHTQENLQTLQKKNVVILGPTEGSQACGDVGPGRMIEPVEIVVSLNQLFSSEKLAGKHVVITAGPTREPIDPVRFISNKSSGKMGYALAEAALEHGARVTLISGPVSLKAPARSQNIFVETAEEMLAEVMKAVKDADIFLSVAAVSDFRCETSSPQKIAKNEMSLTLKLQKNPDIISEVTKLSQKPFVVGFAAETEDVLNKAKIKLKNKKLDMIIANLVGQNVGMESDENEVTVLWPQGEKTFSKMSKQKLARELIIFIAEHL